MFFLFWVSTFAIWIWLLGSPLVLFGLFWPPKAPQSKSETRPLLLGFQFSATSNPTSTLREGRKRVSTRRPCRRPLLTDRVTICQHNGCGVACTAAYAGAVADCTALAAVTITSHAALQSLVCSTAVPTEMQLQNLCRVSGVPRRAGSPAATTAVLLQDLRQSRADRDGPSVLRQWGSVHRPCRGR